MKYWAETGEFKPAKYKDTYRENLQKLIAAKAKGKAIKRSPEPEVPKVVDIMEALKQSLAEMEGKKKPAARAGREAAAGARRSRRG